MTKCKTWLRALPTAATLVVLGIGGCGGANASDAGLDTNDTHDTDIESSPEGGESMGSDDADFGQALDPGEDTGEGETGHDVDPSEPHNERSPVGINLAALSDWHAAFPFLDLFHQSRAWVSGVGSTWDDGRTLDLDDDGWVRSLGAGQIARTRIYGVPEGTPLPWTRLVVLYDGEGALEYSGGVQLDQAVSSTGRDVLEIQGADASMSLSITHTDPGDYVRNIRVLPVGGVCSDDAARACTDGAQCDSGATCLAFEEVHQAQPFHPQFLARIERYGTLRFMDWMATNDSMQSSWAERPRVEESTWSGARGAPVEIMVELANRTHTNPWFTLPHLADDDYVRQFAHYVRDHLDPSLVAYVEHSNEVWNGVFGQAQFVRDEGLARGLSDDPLEAGLRYHSRRSLEMFAIWDDVFGGTERLVRVMGSQAANAWISEQLLAFESAHAKTDVLAIAPYFGGYLGTPEREAEVASMNIQGLMQELEHTAVPQSIAWMQAAEQVADDHGVDLISYEGGQHLAAHGSARDNAAINALFDAANRHPEMKRLYLEYLDAWSEHGDLFVHFTDCSSMGTFGRWGAVEYSTQARAEAPKYDALLTFIETTDAWW